MTAHVLYMHLLSINWDCNFWTSRYIKLKCIIVYISYSWNNRIFIANILASYLFSRISHFIMIRDSKCSACYSGRGSVWFKFEIVCLFVSEREKKERVTRPALPPGCLAPNSHQPAGAETENLLPLATVQPHTHKGTTHMHTWRNPRAFITHIIKVCN